jgi:hypothetical protein
LAPARSSNAGADRASAIERRPATLANPRAGCDHPFMDAQTIDQEFEKLQTEFQEVAQAVKDLATKMQAAQAAGDQNAAGWLGDLEAIAKEVDDEQTQAKVLLLALHSFITDAAQSAAPASEGEKPPLFAPGQDPFPDEDPQRQLQQQQRPHGLFGGMMGGLMGGGGGYMGGGFAQAMEMGMGMSLGADLVNSIFR